MVIPPEEAQGPTANLNNVWRSSRIAHGEPSRFSFEKRLFLWVPSLFDSLRCGSPRSSLMEVKESEAQGRRREAHV